MWSAYTSFAAVVLHYHLLDLLRYVSSSRKPSVISITHFIINNSIKLSL